MSTNATSATKESNVDTSAVGQAGAAAAAGSFTCVFTWPAGMQKSPLTLTMPAASLVEKDLEGTSIFSGKLRYGGNEVSSVHALCIFTVAILLPAASCYSIGVDSVTMFHDHDW